MLKITDSTGETIGVLKDEDTAPEMKEKGEQDGTVGTMEQDGEGSSEAEDCSGD